MDENLTKAASDITGLLVRLAGPLADEAGQILGDRAREYRIRNATRIFQRVKKMLLDAGIEPQPIASRLFLPAFEAASIEDNETLQEKWAALLANASDGNGNVPIFPSFVEILKELTPEEAKFLAHLYQRPDYYALSIDRGVYLGTFDDVRLRWNATASNQETQQTALMLDDLVRLGLLDRQTSQVSGRASALEGLSANIAESQYFLTRFGITFVEACTAPTSGRDQGTRART
jgi:Abortive infection alpha